jgi:hypothetical protein
MANSKNDPGTPPSTDSDSGQSDVYGNDGEKAGTIDSDWWQTDGTKTWTDNNGGDHEFEVNDDHW